VVYNKTLFAKAGLQPPGPDWTFSGERFVDPSTGELLEVWQRARSGERAYVRAP